MARPTARDILRSAVASSGVHLGDLGAVNAIDALAEHGYVIAHPDDVEKLPDADYEPYTNGWNNCRRRIFGDGA